MSAFIFRLHIQKITITEPDRSWRHFFDQYVARAGRRSCRSRMMGLGISFPGIVNLTMQEITYSHVLGLHAIPFAEVTRHFPYPCHAK